MQRVRSDLRRENQEPAELRRDTEIGCYGGEVREIDARETAGYVGGCGVFENGAEDGKLKLVGIVRSGKTVSLGIVPASESFIAST